MQTNGTADGFHANNTVNPAVIVYDLGITVQAGDTFFFDAWGRTGGNAGRQSRDDNYNINFFSGGVEVFNVDGEGIANPNNVVNRTVITGLAAGTVIDQIQVEGINTQFTIQEVRFAVEPIPEPSSALLLGLAGAGFLVRRRK